MSIYDKPVWLLMKDMVKDLNVSQDQIITREQVSSWFKNNYPKIKPSTVSAHLLKMSINAPSRIHYNLNLHGEDDLFYQIDSQRFRLYNPQHDPAPIYEKIDGGTEPDGEDKPELIEATEFAYERDLKNFLSKNLHLIDFGLKLYEDGEGITGIEFPVGGRFIDILAVDKRNNYVVIELKVSRGYDRVIGQLLRYMAWIEKYQADPGQYVSGIIVAREISKDLLLAASKVPTLKLFEYQLSVKLQEIH